MIFVVTRRLDAVKHLGRVNAESIAEHAPERLMVRDVRISCPEYAIVKLQEVLGAPSWNHVWDYGAKSWRPVALYEKFEMSELL